MTAAISVRGLVKEYPAQKRQPALRAVDGVSFDVPEGDFFGFLGPNGAGKTSTIHCMVGLATITAGAIAVFGHDVRLDYRKARRLIGLSPQEFNFDRYLSIRETLIYSAGYFGIPERECKDRADDLLKRFELYSKRDLDFTKLSGGMKRRLSIARALIHRPRVLVLDEPTAGVDVELRLELWQFLRTANTDGLTVFLTTHYLEEAEELCNRIAIIESGKIIALEDKSALMARMSGHTLIVEFCAPIAELPLMANAEWNAERTECRVRGLEPDQVAGVLGILAQAGEVRDMGIDKKSLQDIFLELTGRAQAEGARA